MTHDPLCPYQPERSTNCEMKSGVMCAVAHYTPPVPCQCSLIAKVRADERKRYGARIEEESQRIDRMTLQMEDWLEEIRARRAAREAASVT